MRKIFLILSMFAGAASFAQDPHFSQYYASQSTVNPATAGLFTGDMRISGLYRQQWPQFGSPYVTGTVAAEWKPNGFKDGQSPNILAVGGMLLYDRTPDAVLKSQYAYGTIAYHKALDEEGHSRIGVGFMAGYNQRMLNASGLTFASQFQSGGFGSGGGEVIPSRKIATFDTHAGLLYSYQDETRLFYGGGSVYHVLRPKDYFIKNNDLLTTMTRRWNAHAGLNVNTTTFRYAASALFMYQQGSKEILVGGAVGLPFSEEGILYAGSWYRLGEAIIPTINLEWKSMNIGISYDAYLDKKTTLVKPKSIEISLAYRVVPMRDLKTGCFAF